MEVDHPGLRQKRLEEGDGILIAPGTTYYICVEGSDATIRYGHMDFTAFGSVELSSVFSFSPLLRPERAARIGQAIEELGRIEADTVSAVLTAEEMRISLMRSIFAHFDEPGGLAALHQARRIAPALELIGKNIEHPISRADLARSVSLSESRFSAVFTEIMNVSPMSDLRRAKLNEARTRLIQRGSSVKEVANQLGFCDQFHFSKMYQKLFGVSPSEDARGESIHP